MSKRKLPVVIGLVVLTIAILTAASQSADERRPLEVRVSNLPEVQTVTGKVSVVGRIEIDPTSIGPFFRSFSEDSLPPTSKAEVRRWKDFGTLDTRGIAELVLTLTVVTDRNTITRPGKVGVVLLPDTGAIVRAKEEESQLLLAIESAALITGPSKLTYASTPVRALVAFPSYRVYFYNETDANVKLNTSVNLLR